MRAVIQRIHKQNVFCIVLISRLSGENGGEMYRGDLNATSEIPLEASRRLPRGDTCSTRACKARSSQAQSCAL